MMEVWRAGRAESPQEIVSPRRIFWRDQMKTSWPVKLRVLSKVEFNQRRFVVPRI